MRPGHCGFVGCIFAFAAVAPSFGQAPSHPFVYSNGAMHDIGTLGGTNGDAFAINDTGLITGVSETPGNNNQHTFTFLYSGATGSILDLDVATGSGLYNSEGHAINKAGSIAGFGSPAGLNTAVEPVLYSNGSVIPLPSLGAFCNISMGINDLGDVVGRSGPHCNGDRFPLIPGDPTQRAFLDHNGTAYDLNYLITTSGWTIYEAAGINNNGQIAATGIFNGQYFAVRLDPEAAPPGSSLPQYTVTNLGTLGGNPTVATAINKSGQVSGYSQTPGAATHAVLFSNGTVVDLGTLGGTNSQAYGINDNAHLVGVADTGQGTQHAFLYQNGPLVDLGTLGGQSSSAEAINNNDQVVGTSTLSNGANFYTVTPCRFIDTRIKLGDPNGPILSGQFRYPQLIGNCGIPIGSTAVAFNITIVNPNADGFLTLAAQIGNPPQTSTVNFRRGQVRANNQVLGLSPDGVLAAYCGMSATGATDYILDVTGYFK